MNIFLIKLQCFLINLKGRVRGKQHLVYPEDNGLYRISDTQQSIYIARLNRHNRYKKGIAQGVDMLAEEYSLNEIDTKPGDILIECGANVGELSVWAKSHSLVYMGFEPEEKEFCCVKLNASKGAQVYRNALWHEKKH